MKLSIIIPCYNEDRTLGEIIKKVKLASLPGGWEKEIIIINDGSTDDTARLLGEIGVGCIVIHKNKNEGKGAALRDGFKQGSGDYFIIQDADLEYDPGEYEKMLEPVIKRKADVVFGSRCLKKDNVLYTHISYFYGNLCVVKIFNWVFNTNLTDITTCYKLFSRSFLPSLTRLSSDGFVFDAIDLTYVLSMGGGVVEVPISYRPRNKKDGKKIKWRDGIIFLFAIARIKLRN